MMSKQKSQDILSMDERKLSILVFALFFSWLLAFPFEGQVLYALADKWGVEVSQMIFGSITAHFLGLFSCGYLIKTMKAAKWLMQFSILFCITGCFVFFFAPSVLWYIFLLSSSFLAGTCVAAWGYYLKSATPPNERIKTTADGLIYSNILMILMNMMAIHLSPYVGLAFSILLLGGAFWGASRLPDDSYTQTPMCISQTVKIVSPMKPLAFLCLFIVVITINSGLMYQVVNPAFAHHEWLVSWYWAVPYIITLYIVKNLPKKTNRTYILYVAIAMIGLSFIAFMTMDRSAASYLAVDTLMLGACGVYDLFWWSILGEMLDLDKNPAKILGIGLSANVLGVLLGGLLGSVIAATDARGYNSSVLALAIVFITIIILPLLHSQLSKLLKNHTFLVAMSEMLPAERNQKIGSFTVLAQLTERESEIASLLLKGRTYKMIAGELFLSENTVKTHIRNIYAKYNIQSKTELIHLLMETEHSSSR